MKVSEKLTETLNQEQELQFDEFTNGTALKLGLKLIELAKQGNKSIAVDIMKNGQRLFYHAMDGTSPDQEHWIRRKSNVVNRHFHSSFYVKLYNESKNRSYFDAYSVNPEEYAVHGGSFPLIIKNTGVIGTITVSGLSQEEDHQLIVDGLRSMLHL
ncbi:heme-degrading domain-containing protein [Fictibacillus sp. NRS-1165]|uniref:heme-degrading domain-containing protein n=1 Tax=Fictibacillus sp. NRS-1165 TaxID=3144463 RepID=UPI003D1F3721